MKTNRDYAMAIAQSLEHAPARAPPMAALPLTWACPYCGNTQATPTMCGHCGRNPTAPRRVCAACKMMTPKSERACWHCGVAFGNELSCKIPVVILVIILSAFLQFVIRGMH